MHDPAKIQLIMELRRGGIRDPRLLNVIETLPRELFVEQPFRARAYDNAALPIAGGQTISQPYAVAFMTQALEVGPRMKVLEVGTGSGYQAAVLSRLCRRVYSVERYRSLHDRAEERFRALGIHNITSRHGDGMKGWPEQAPFERILVTAAASRIPTTLVDQLAEGGVMVFPLEKNPGAQVIMRLTRTAKRIETCEMIPTRFVPLVEGVAQDG
ncbi:MAG: protein-L-isoaspartate(D-aspartate) O-methyltransferase [Alphaproteobacteria bacterium]|nr:MAG: protein-L-isoaspartate(D-aspartate) O-methyltransferase [Alphaproteobacteria bacterium]